MADREEVKLRGRICETGMLSFKPRVKERGLWASRVVNQKRKKCWVKE